MATEVTIPDPSSTAGPDTGVGIDAGVGDGVGFGAPTPGYGPDGPPNGPTSDVPDDDGPGNDGPGDHGDGPGNGDGEGEGCGPWSRCVPATIDMGAKLAFLVLGGVVAVCLWISTSGLFPTLVPGLLAACGVCVVTGVGLWVWRRRPAHDPDCPHHQGAHVTDDTGDGDGDAPTGRGWWRR